MKKGLKINGEQELLTNLLKFSMIFVPVVFWSQESDPFNAPKLFILGLFVFPILALSFKQVLRNASELKSFRYYIFIIMILGLLLSFFFSGAPKISQIYGVYGRNTGLLCTLLLMGLTFGSMCLSQVTSIEKILKSIWIVTSINMLLAVLEILNLNPQRVGDNYRNDLIGTFGNPNFFSAFLGISSVMQMALLIGENHRRRDYIAQSVFYFLTIFFIFRSHSFQGLAIALGGTALVIVLRLIKSNQKIVIKVSAVTLFLISLIFGLLGVGNKGPLASIIYESSVGFRIQYWKAALEMFKSNVFTGVGLNAYGDWYRFFRTPESLIAPGLNTVTNAAHNVFLDYASTGGILLILGFLGLNILAIVGALKSFRRNSAYQPILVALTVAQICYLVQAAVSIDQIGLAVLGWILPGCIFSFEKLTRNSTTPIQGKSKRVGNSKNEIPASDVLIGFGAALLACLTILPLIQADMKWSEGIKSGDLEKLEVAANSWPRNENFLVGLASIELNNKLPEKSLRAALIAVQHFPRSFMAWQLILNNDFASKEQRKNALKQLIMLDPLNQELKKIRL